MAWDGRSWWHDRLLDDCGSGRDAALRLEIGLSRLLNRTLRRPLLRRLNHLLLLLDHFPTWSHLLLDDLTTFHHSLCGRLSGARSNDLLLNDGRLTGHHLLDRSAACGQRLLYDLLLLPGLSAGNRLLDYQLLLLLLGR